MCRIYTCFPRAPFSCRWWCVCGHRLTIHQEQQRINRCRTISRLLAHTVGHRSTRLVLFCYCVINKVEGNQSFCVFWHVKRTWFGKRVRVWFGNELWKKRPAYSTNYILGSPIKSSPEVHTPSFNLRRDPWLDLCFATFVVELSNTNSPWSQTHVLHYCTDAYKNTWRWFKWRYMAIKICTSTNQVFRLV
jgi:hypothetical protein